MKKLFLLSKFIVRFGLPALALAAAGILGLMLGGCGQIKNDSNLLPQATSSPIASSIPSVTPSPSSSATISNYFNVSGAKAIAMAAKNSSSAASVRALDVSPNDLIKINISGEISSIINLPSESLPPIAEIVIGPDGCLYVGLSGRTSFSSIFSEEIAFFKIKPNGSFEVVDSFIYGIGPNYGAVSDGRKKWIQFDSLGNLYYLCRIPASGKGSATIIRKKTTIGNFEQIGNNNMAIDDFVLMKNGIFLFHGTNINAWGVKWLRTINKDNSVHNIFYNDSSVDSSSYLRAYYLDNQGNIVLVGTNMRLEDASGEVNSYSGIVRVEVDDFGKLKSIQKLYDDSNMYNDSGNSFGYQLINGYWEGTTWKYFFKNLRGDATTPLSFEAGINEESVRTFIKGKFQYISFETLSEITFEGMDISPEGETVHGVFYDTLISKIDTELAHHINGTTWAQWRKTNGLSEVAFGWAKQFILSDDGTLYALINLDGWSGSAAKGDRLYRVVNSSGGTDPAAFLQNDKYVSVKKMECYGNNVVYLSSVLGKSKILKLDLSNPSAPPVDMTADKTNVEIYSFNYNPATNKLLYDVYDMNNNTSYVIEQDVSNILSISQSKASDYTILNIVPFNATN